MKQIILAAPGAWVARYQVRQNFNKYRYYKLQVPILYFQCTTSDKLSKLSIWLKLVLKSILMLLCLFLDVVFVVELSVRYYLWI
ncbi:hypothetical protein [Trichormus azollae]|uniref:hypothetical protein n=1 Tax=Trichormus azollae TaxID=1164 RepID=UPI00325EF4F5